MRLAIKLGGSIIEDGIIRKSILAQLAKLRGGGHEILLVHGGGKSLNRRLAQLGIQSRFVRGLRVTDSETLSVALMVLAGEVNKNLVLELGSCGSRAIGICGADARSVTCVQLTGLEGNSDELGFVGKPVALDPSVFELLSGAGIIPVIASIAVGPGSQAYNVNADQMASICAWGTGCDALVYLTDVRGVLGPDGSVIPQLDKHGILRLRENGVVSGGMLPKTEACLEALEHGVPAIYIAPGDAPGILLRLIQGEPIEGTCIYGHRANE